MNTTSKLCVLAIAAGLVAGAGTADAGKRFLRRPGKSVKRGRGVPEWKPNRKKLRPRTKPGRTRRRLGFILPDGTRRPGGQKGVWNDWTFRFRNKMGGTIKNVAQTGLSTAGARRRFGNKMGGLVKGVAQTGLSTAGAVIPGASVLRKGRTTKGFAPLKPAEFLKRGHRRGLTRQSSNARSIQKPIVRKYDSQ